MIIKSSTREQPIPATPTPIRRNTIDEESVAIPTVNDILRALSKGEPKSRGMQLGLGMELPTNETTTYYKRIDNVNDQLLYIGIIEKILKLKNEHLDLKFTCNKQIGLKQIEQKDFINLLKNIPGELFIIDYDYIIISKELDSIIIFEWSDRQSRRKMEFTVGTKEYDNIEKIYNVIVNVFKDYITTDKIYANITWHFQTKGDDYSVEFKEELDDIIHQEAYPYIENLETLIENYINSTETVLLLLGPPGTGKTRLIRYILKKMSIMNSSKEISGYFTSDKEIVSESSMYINFLSMDHVSFLVIEDMDYHLQKRSDGNFSMYNLLAVSDGLLKNIGNKKIILSSNLPNVKDVDEALLRSGRCFANIKTRKLTIPESKELIKKLSDGKLDPDLKESISLSEIYKLTNACKI